MDGCGALKAPPCSMRASRQHCAISFWLKSQLSRQPILLSRGRRARCAPKTASSRPMPNSSRTRSSKKCLASRRPLQTTFPREKLPRPQRRRRSRSLRLPGLEVTSPEAWTRVRSRLPRRGATVTASTCALSLDSRASYAAASHRIRIISRYLQPRALGRKASDEFTVPLCRVHHRAAHRAGDERAWWKAAGIDPMKFAGRLWKQTRVNEGRLPADQIMQTPQSGLALNAQPIGSAGRDIG